MASSDAANVPIPIDAAGGFVYRGLVGRREVILVTVKQPPEWRLPKGLVEPGESLEDAARREVSEETGIVADIIAPVGNARWIYDYQGRAYDKRTTYFLMRYVTGDPDERPPSEVAAVMWCAIGEAAKLLAFESERGIATVAERLLLT